MKQDDFKKYEARIKQKLDEYEVNVPNFPMKKSIMTRIANWVFTPTSIPFPESGYSVPSSLLILSLPMLLVVATVVTLLFI